MAIDVVMTAIAQPAVPVVGSASRSDVEASVQLDTAQTWSGSVDLDTDDPVEVSLDAVGGSAAAVSLEASGAATADLTSAEGVATVPVSPALSLVSRSRPITGVTLSRAAGGPAVRVDVFLAAAT